VPASEETPGYAEETADCWFDEPEPGDRRSWAVPPAHGIYQELDLQLLDPAEEDERALLIEALHPEFADALQGEDDVIIEGEPVNPRLHVAMHQVVANQLLANDPPETWQTVQRLARGAAARHRTRLPHWSRTLWILATSPPGRLRPAAERAPGDWPPPKPARWAWPGVGSQTGVGDSRPALCT
jgi:hypothetical protein